MLRPALVRTAAKAAGARSAAAASRAYRSATAAAQLPTSPSAGRPGSSLQQMYEAHTAAAMGDSRAADGTTDPLVQALHDHLAAVFVAEDAAASRLCAGPALANTNASAPAPPPLGSNGTGGSCAPRNSAREQAQAMARLLERSAARHQARGL